jgi:hypothetical protein
VEADGQRIVGSLTIKKLSEREVLKNGKDLFRVSRYMVLEMDM